MIKRLLLFSLLTAGMGTALYFAQSYYLQSESYSLAFSLEGVYLFHLIAFLIIIVSVEFLSQKLPSQVGFFYLASMFVKIGAFLLIFGNKLFADEKLPLTDRIQILIPFMLFLAVEALYSGRLMNAK